MLYVGKRTTKKILIRNLLKRLIIYSLLQQKNYIGSVFINEIKLSCVILISSVIIKIFNLGTRYFRNFFLKLRMLL